MSAELFTSVVDICDLQFRGSKRAGAWRTSLDTTHAPPAQHIAVRLRLTVTLPKKLASKLSLDAI
jgi:hypothetical protein